MKNLLNLFRPSAREAQLEEELSGKPSTRQTPSAIQPPKRGTAIPGSMTPTHPEAGAGELATLRASLASIEQKLQAAHQERDNIVKQFQDYRQASQADVRELERENATLKQRFHEVSLELSKQVAAGGLNGPISENGSAEVVRSGGDEIRGLARSIAAAKAEAAATKFERIPRPTL